MFNEVLSTQKMSGGGVLSTQKTGGGGDDNESMDNDLISDLNEAYR